MDGYKIIDCKGIDASSGDTVPGIFNAIAETTKPLVFCNIAMGDDKIKPFFSGLYFLDDGDYVFPLNSSMTMTIDSDDLVVIAT